MKQTNNFMSNSVTSGVTTPSGTNKIKGLTSANSNINNQAIRTQQQPIAINYAQQAANLGSAMQQITEGLQQKQYN